MNISIRPFGTLSNGRTVSCWTIENDRGLKAEVLDYGVTIRSVVVPDRNGKPVDVVLGFDNIEDYPRDGDFLGATIGRFANRIGGGSFELNGKTYNLAVNNGPNTLHGGLIGYDQVIWKSEATATGVRFSMTSPDGDEGFPGNLKIDVTVSWQGNGLELRYHAECDQDTILNLTNHSYFNLDGGGCVHDHLLTINADTFTMNDENCLPTGEICPVEGTAMDFRTEHRIGERVDSDEPCVKLCGGYDSNFCLNGNPGAVVRSEKTGIVMTMTTDQPGVQLYTANFKKDRVGKYGVQYGKRCALCLETQHYPDSIHHPEWPTCILRKGEAFDSYTRYEFSVE